ncbi:hypothetical protein CYMTET_57076 [Cymbomonas tetramitiformis]|uniref:DUF7869 domain-containing protein n=1 Tax=Cymbomonas tetramitiformis TaxID=36881 RepID=A0AAE0BB10_9CHLO|nr:hypothetical protein CYMTET_57076 [Cymbomonas tetramitiformis]
MIPKTTVFQEKKIPKTPFGPCYDAFKDWAMVHMLKGLPQDMPTDGSLQIKPLDYDVEYINYRRLVAEPVLVVNKTFRKYCRHLVKKELNIRIRKKVEVSGMCSICDNLDARWAKLQASDPDHDAWKELTNLKESHSETHKYQRNCYDARRRESADPLGEIDSIALDGAANKNTVVPHAPHQVKHINEKKQNFFNLHLQLTIFHGCMLLFNLSFPWSKPKGANMMLTSFTNLLVLLAFGHSGKRFFRKTLHLQVDGGSENWNRYTFGFCALLVHYGIYHNLVLHRLMVGHTHNDVDGWFGLMKMYIFGKDATKAGRWLVLLEDYINWLVSWPVNKFLKLVQVQGQQLDFKKWLKPHLNWNLTGYGGMVRDVHYVEFQKDEHGVVRMKYKGGDHIKPCLPKGVDEDLTKGLEVMNNYPDIDSSPPLQEVQPLPAKEEAATLNAFQRLCDHGVDRISHEQQEHLCGYFPLPQKASDYDTWKGPKFDQQQPLDLKLLLSNAWHQNTTEASDPATTEPQPELETIADGRNVMVKDLPVDIPKITKRCEQEARRVEDISFWYNKGELKAVLQHMGLDGAGLAAELATRLFNATAAARKEHQEKGRRVKLQLLKQVQGKVEAKDVGENNWPRRSSCAVGKAERSRQRTWGRSSGPDSQATACQGAKKGRGKGRGVRSTVPNSQAAVGRGAGMRANAAAGIKRVYPSSPPSSPVQDSVKTRKVGQAEAGDPKRPRGSPPTTASPTFSPPQRKARTRSANNGRCLFQESPEKSESDSYDDMPLLQRAARPVTAPAVSVKSDSSDEDDMPLAQRAVARFLPADYTFEMITAVPKTFAVTAAGENNPADECWFTVPLARGKVSLPMHYVEVLDLDLEKRLVHWQFWIPRAANLTPASKPKLRTFKNTDLLFIADAFRRGGVRHRAWHPFNPAEMPTCWDERICPPEGGMPSGPEKEELLKTIADNLFSE